MKRENSWLQPSEYPGDHILFKWSSDCLSLSFWPRQKPAQAVTACAKGLRLLEARGTGDASHSSWKTVSGGWEKKSGDKPTQDDLTTFKKPKRNSCLLGCLPWNVLRIKNMLLAERQNLPPSSVLLLRLSGRREQKSCKNCSHPGQKGKLSISKECPHYNYLIILIDNVKWFKYFRIQMRTLENHVISFHWLSLRPEHP